MSEHLKASGVIAESAESVESVESVEIEVVVYQCLNDNEGSGLMKPMFQQGPNHVVPFRTRIPGSAVYRRRTWKRFCSNMLVFYTSLNFEHHRDCFRTL